MRKIILFLALALLLCGCVDGATKIGLDRLNWSQSMPYGANIILDGGYILGTSLDAGIVSVGDGPEYDIDINDYTIGYQGEAITDAIDLAMTRNGNTGANIFIGSGIIDNSNGNEIYINYTGLVHGVPLRITGSGLSWYGEGTTIKSPKGMVIGSAFVDGVDGAWLSDFYLLGSVTSPANIGISCNATAERVNLERIRIGQYSVGIQFENYYNNILNNVVVGFCNDGAINISGNHNQLYNVIIAQPPDCPDLYGLKVTGLNNIINIDIGVAGEDGGSKGIWIVGDGNIVESCWIEPISTEGVRVYLDDAYRNEIKMAGTDPDAPYGVIALHYSNENKIDPTYMPSRGGTSGAFFNITFDMSFYNQIKMSPFTQTDARGVLNRTDGEILDYGHILGTAAPNSGYWYKGAVVWNSEPATGQPVGWICTSTGSPGTWKAMANIA